MGKALRVEITLDAAAVAERAQSAARMAVAAAGEDILSRAVALAPRRTGALAASAQLRVEGATASVSFGAPYAPYQHDAAGLRHPGGGRAGFLRDAVEDPATLDAMAAAFAAGFDTGA